jgi:hypothetical protein
MTVVGLVALSAAAERFLSDLASPEGQRRTRSPQHPKFIADLLSAELVARGPHDALELTAVGRAHVMRTALARSNSPIDPYVGQHLAIAQRDVDGPEGRAGVTVNDAESPLAWLARRKGRDGQPMIEADQLLAGEKLRLTFTRAQLMPRITSNWQAAVADGARGAAGGQAAHLTDVIVAARQAFRHALEAVGPEFAGLLVDVCCFLKGLEDCERERHWPPRSAKVVLQLGLDRLARHYGLGNSVRGKARVPLRTWLAAEVALGAGPE